MKSPFLIAAAFTAVVCAGPASADPADDIIAKNKCHSCHTATTTKKGPSWASLAEKYKSQPDAADKLFKELKAGGKVGGEDDHLAIKASDADIKAVVQKVLSSK